MGIGRAAAVVFFALAILAGGCGPGAARSADTLSAPGMDFPVLVAAGDIASCASSGDEATADLLAKIDGTVITLGDNAYEQGSAENYRECYDPTHGSAPEVRPLWEALYEAGADVVLSGHEHNYERFAPQDPSGRADPDRGIREFVVGTGGKSHYEIEVPLTNSEVHNDYTYGVLKLTLHPKSYDWRFIPAEGEAFTDSGRGRCH